MSVRAIFDRVRAVSPHGALLAGLVVGTVLLMFSFLLGIASVTIEKDGIERQVGYAAAPNWSLVFTILFPLFVYFALGAIHSTDRAFPSLDGMLVEKNGKRDADAAASLARRYKNLLTGSSRVAMVLAALALIGSIAEWFAFSGMPLLIGTGVPEAEIDWSVAALGESVGRRIANATFSLLAFTLQGIYVAALLIFLVYIYVFCDLARQLSDATQPPMLVPDVDSQDPRRGFQRLGRVVEEIIFACGCMFLIFWISRVQNLYLQSKATSLWAYLLGDLGTSEVEFGWSMFASALSDTGGIEFSSAMVILGAVSVIGVCIGVPLHTLRRAAETARETARDLSARRPRVFARHCSDAQLAKSLDSMVVWPIAYPRINQLLFWLAFALLSLVFYRIGVAFLLVWIWRLVKRAFDKIDGKGPEPTAAPA